VAGSAAIYVSNCSFFAFRAFSLSDIREPYFAKLNISFKSVFCKNLKLLSNIHRKVDTEHQLNFSIMTPRKALMIYTITVIVYIISACAGALDEKFKSIKL
jgi:hypothetical protein